jgi:hypothetical protein
MPAPSERQSLIVHDSRTSQVSPDVADAVAQGVRVGFGIVALGLGVAIRALGEVPAHVPRQPGPRMPVSDVADLLVGTAWGTARLSGRLAATGARVAAPVLGLAFHPPLVPRHLQPGHGMALLVERWQRDRPETVRSLGRWSATALPGAVDAALGQVDAERVVTVVLDRVDLDRVLDDVLGRIDLDALLASVLSRVDLDRIIAGAFAGMDLDGAVSLALQRLDIDKVASDLLGQLDLTQIVLDRVDLERVVASALERLDLTAIVVDEVDLGRVVAAALQRVDLTQVVLQQVDLIGVAEYVVEGIDLPEIIRDSTGSVASEAVRGLRMQGVDADAAVARVVDRMLHRRRQRHVDRGPVPESSSEPPADALSGRQA